MIPSRTETIRDYRSHGGRIAAVFPAHYPRALLRAFDILPVEVWGPPQLDPGPGSAHVQPYICSVVRNSISFVLSRQLDVADLLIVPHTCDSLQGLGSILLDFVRPGQPVLPLYLPKSTRASDAEFLTAELRALYARLAKITGCRPSDEEMLACIAEDEKADALLAELHRRRLDLPLSMLDFYRLVRSREFLPASAFIGLAEEALGQANQAAREGSIPILISGIVPEPMELFSALAEMNGVVVADDLLACGRRVYPAGTSTDPFVRMAERILHAPPDSTRGSSIHDRLGHLIGLAKQSGAKGVLFYDIKFCEPELFYLPTLRQGLQEAGFPSTVIEADLGEALSGPVRTRLEAFLEMLV